MRYMLGDPHVTGGETEAQNDEAACRESHNMKGVEAGLEAQSSGYSLSS